MINDGKPVVWLFLYIRYLENRSSVKRTALAEESTEAEGAPSASRLQHLPGILGFMSSDYR